LAVAEMETGKSVLTSLLLSSWSLNRGCSRPACNGGCKNLNFLMKYKIYRYIDKSRSGKIRNEALLVELIEKLQNLNLAPSKQSLLPLTNICIRCPRFAALLEVCFRNAL
jgi:hypothetical protein